MGPVWGGKYGDEEEEERGGGVEPAKWTRAVASQLRVLTYLCTCTCGKGWGKHPEDRERGNSSSQHLTPKTHYGSFAFAEFLPWAMAS